MVVKFCHSNQYDMFFSAIAARISNKRCRSVDSGHPFFHGCIPVMVVRMIEGNDFRNSRVIVCDIEAKLHDVALKDLTPYDAIPSEFVEWRRIATGGETINGRRIIKAWLRRVV